MPRLEVLDWDTTFFGFAIARAEIEGAGREELDAIDTEARSHGIVCIYASLDGADVPSTVLVQEHGYRFVEAATTFTLRPDEPEIPCPSGVTVRLGGPSDLPALEPIADRLAPWSRFAVDPGFGLDAARRLQRAATERAARDGSGEHQLVVAERDGEIEAFITRRRSPEPRVDAVGTTARGSGSARYLIEDARRWAGDRPLLGGPIAARNVNALRYVSRCGYRVSEVRYLYHRWL